MAKTIKFNLICDEKPVRTIEDLQDNFSIEDIYRYYGNGLLLRWLDVRGYVAEAEKVKAISSKDDALSIVKELIKIFDIEADSTKVEEGVYMMQFLDERKERLETYKKHNFKLQSIIDGYKNGYEQLVHGIIENPKDVSIIKANIKEIASNYTWVMNLDHRALFWKLIEQKSFLAIMCLLMNEKTRDYYLPVKETRKLNDGSECEGLDTDNDLDKNNMYKKICELIDTKNFEEQLGENLRSFSGVTDGYWKDLETKDKKYMIISMGDGDYVRSAGVSGGDRNKSDILNKFIIVQGIDYKSNSDKRKLRYMEV